MSSRTAPLVAARRLRGPPQAAAQSSAPQVGESFVGGLQMLVDLLRADDEDVQVRREGPVCPRVDRGGRASQSTAARSMMCPLRLGRVRAVSTSEYQFRHP